MAEMLCHKAGNVIWSLPEDFFSPAMDSRSAAQLITKCVTYSKQQLNERDSIVLVGDDVRTAEMLEQHGFMMRTRDERWALTDRTMKNLQAYRTLCSPSRVFEPRPAVPMHERTTHELLLALEEDGWQWSRWVPRSARKRHTFIPDAFRQGDQKVWYSTLLPSSAYMQVLLRSEECLKNLASSPSQCACSSLPLKRLSQALWPVKILAVCASFAAHQFHVCPSKSQLRSSLRLDWESVPHGATEKVYRAILARRFEAANVAPDVQQADGGGDQEMLDIDGEVGPNVFEGEEAQLQREPELQMNLEDELAELMDTSDDDVLVVIEPAAPPQAAASSAASAPGANPARAEARAETIIAEVLRSSSYGAFTIVPKQGTEKMIHGGFQARCVWHRSG